MLDYRGKVVWITGASSGIGEGLAYEFARQGARLVLSARRADVLESVRQKCANAEQHFVLPIDMTDTDSLAGRVEAVLTQCGHVDVLINNAGVSQRSLVKDTDLSVDRRIMEVDFFGPVALTKAVLPHMLTRGSGQLVVVSSVVGLVATPYRSAYAAAKHAIAGFYDALRAEVHDSGVRVSVIYPGFVRSNVSLSALTGTGDAHGQLDDKQATAMSSDEFARKAVAALAGEEERIIIAGKEKLAVWLGRLSPGLLSRVIRKVKVT
ncbi:MAG TPA: short chain dehydrogenase [Moraxellaceae bacterium]|nr:short chain dehydrogenase [Moraxellaceae bacterium]